MNIDEFDYLEEDRLFEKYETELHNFKVYLSELPDIDKFLREKCKVLIDVAIGGHIYRLYQYDGFVIATEQFEDRSHKILYVEHRGYYIDAKEERKDVHSVVRFIDYLVEKYNYDLSICAYPPEEEWYYRLRERYRKR